eukprot:gene31304-58243_t
MTHTLQTVKRKGADNWGAWEPGTACECAAEHQRVLLVRCAKVPFVDPFSRAVLDALRVVTALATCGIALWLMDWKYETSHEL